MRALLQGISCQGLGAERLLEKLKAAGAAPAEFDMMGQ